jgi:hypothetical protein
MDTTDFVKSRRMREITTTLTYEDTTAAVAFTLPKGTRLVAWVFNVKTAFSGGTGTVDIGITGDTDYLVDGGDVSSAGQAMPTTTVAHPGYETTNETPVYMSVGAGNSAGEVDVTLLFALETDRRL